MKLKWVVAAAALLAVAPRSSAWAQANAFANGSGSASASSWVGGAQAGYNWQRDWLVYGVEADISGLHLQPQIDTALGGAFPPPVLGEHHFNHRLVRHRARPRRLVVRAVPPLRDRRLGLRQAGSEQHR